MSLDVLTVLAAGSSGGDFKELQGWDYIWNISVIVFLLLLNAFFVASEFAIVKVRPSQIDGEMAEKPRRATMAKHVVGHLDGYLSANQLGITIASLTLGFFAEPFIEALIGPHFVDWGMTKEAAGRLSWWIAIISFTFLHVVIGELLPKSIAIRKSLATTMVLARPLHWFYVAFKWAIWVLNGTANWLLKVLFRIDPVGEGEEVHSSAELALLVEESERQQQVTETEREILINALELNEVSVKDVITPRSEVVALDVDDSFEKNVEMALKSKHTRFPLVKGHLDHNLGLVHIKDFLKLVGKDDPDLMQVKRDLKVVPETMKLDDLLQFFLKERAHLAMAVDEFGDPAGLVFMDNVMEALVGDIQDEFDNESSGFTQISEDEFVVEGAMSLNELSDFEDGIDLESGEISTIGGYVTQQLGRFPKRGEKMEISGFQATVTNVSKSRVGQIHFKKLEIPVEKEEEGATS